MPSDEEVVREYWKDCWDDVDIDGTALVSAMIGRKPVCLCNKRGEPSRTAAWTAARAYTEDHAERVRGIDEEIAFEQVVIKNQQTSCGVEGCGCDEAPKRTLERLQQARAELLRGVKGGAK